MDDYLIITGGFSTTATTTAAVSMYDKTGWLMNLTSLNTGRKEGYIGGVVNLFSFVHSHSESVLYET